MKRLENQVAIVTGGGTGIGRGVALALAVEGVKVVVCGRRQAPLEETVQAIRLASGEALAVVADISDEHDVEHLVQTSLQVFRRIDILINNAAIDGGSSIHTHAVEEWDRIQAINLRGPFLAARAVLPLMRAQLHGQIVNISSESGLEHYLGDGAYGVSKHPLKP